MSQENVEIARRAYELFAAGDLQGVADLIAPDAEVAAAGGMGIAGEVGVRHGPAGMLEAMQEAFEAFDDYRVEVDEIVDAGDAVIVAVLISGTGRASGLAQQERFAHLWKMRDGKVIHGEVHRTIADARSSAAAEG